MTTNTIAEYCVTFSTPCPKWMRTYFVDEATGEAYVPDGFLAMTPQAALLCAGFDGIGIVQKFKHVYVPSSWAKKQTSDPKGLRAIELVENMARGKAS